MELRRRSASRRYRSEESFARPRLILATGVIATALVLNTVHAEDDPDCEGDAGCVSEKGYEIKKFAIPDRGDLPHIKINATVSLIGEPGSKSFGLSYRGTHTPEVEMTGDEKLVVYLYIDCDDKMPSETSGTNVGTVNIGDLKKGDEVSVMIATVDATAFVPLRDVECAKMGIN